ncbi:MAG: (4Fe-4S)-binding protein [Solirubrobacterales bacterium]
MKRYEGKRIQVTYDPARCLHAAQCVRGTPTVFDTERRPWIAPDAGEAEAIAAVVRRCPTGALHYALYEGESEQTRVPTRVLLPEGGPMLLDGDLELDGKRDPCGAMSLWQISEPALLRPQRPVSAVGVRVRPLKHLTPRSRWTKATANTVPSHGP